MKKYFPMTMIVILFALSLAWAPPQTSHAYPVSYAFKGSLDILDVGSGLIYEPFLGRMIFDKEPRIKSFDTSSPYGLIHADWLLTNLTIRSKNFYFVGGGNLNLTGTINTIHNYYEPYLGGFGYTPYWSGPMVSADGPTAITFFHENRTEYEGNALAYLIGTPPPIMKSYFTGGLNIIDDSIGRVRWGELEFYRDDITAPIPEPSTAILLGCGLVGFVLYRRKR